MAKSFCLPIDYVLYEMSYANIIMYGYVLPDGSTDRKKAANGGDGQETIKADDPRNRERVQNIIDGI